MRTDDAISALKAILRKDGEHSEAIGTAIGIMQHYVNNGLSKHGKTTTLPDSREQFGYFIVHECDENGQQLNVVSDDHGNAIEFLPNSVIIEPCLKPS